MYGGDSLISHLMHADDWHHIHTLKMHKFCYIYA